MNFYVYVHKKASDGSIFYVGKGTGRRSHDFVRRSQHWKHIATKHGVMVEFVQSGITEYEALKIEVQTIAEIGREHLCNKTDGGEGFVGLVRTDEHRKKIGSAHKGKKKSPEAIAKMVASITGRKLSDEHKRKLSQIRKGKPKTQEHIKKVAQARIGKHHTEQGKQNIRAAKCKIVCCVETGQQFFGTHHAAEWVKQANPKASQAAISRACCNPKKIAYGYHWEYK
jgi:hypothetical protein